MKQNEVVLENLQIENIEPTHHRKTIVNGVTVYESFRTDGGELWECLLQSMGKH